MERVLCAVALPIEPVNKDATRLTNMMLITPQVWECVCMCEIMVSDSCAAGKRPDVISIHENYITREQNMLAR